MFVFVGSESEIVPTFRMEKNDRNTFAHTLWTDGVDGTDDRGIAHNFERSSAGPGELIKLTA